MPDDVIGYKRDLLKERAIIFAGFAMSIILTATRFYIRTVDAGLMDDDDPLDVSSIRSLYSVEREVRNEESSNVYGTWGNYDNYEYHEQ